MFHTAPYFQSKRVFKPLQAATLRTNDLSAVAFCVEKNTPSSAKPRTTVSLGSGFLFEKRAQSWIIVSNSFIFVWARFSASGQVWSSHFSNFHPIARGHKHKSVLFCNATVAVQKFPILFRCNIWSYVFLRISFRKSLNWPVGGVEAKKKPTSWVSAAKTLIVQHCLRPCWSEGEKNSSPACRPYRWNENCFLSDDAAGRWWGSPVLAGKVN